MGVVPTLARAREGIYIERERHRLDISGLRFPSIAAGRARYRDHMHPIRRGSIPSVIRIFILIKMKSTRLLNIICSTGDHFLTNPTDPKTSRPPDLADLGDLGDLGDLS